ncbi:hypothetical protein B9Z35_08660 [Limnohabitans sp. Jir61]|nr:hypothetical protein B9Z35_08660 [Limnohabitans sp. Jir61]
MTSITQLQGLILAHPARTAQAKVAAFTKIGPKTLAKVFIAHGDKKARCCHTKCAQTYQA